MNPGPQKRKLTRMDLGLCLLQMCCKPGEPLTSDDQACWCGCSRQRMDQIYQMALRKLRNHLLFRDKETWEELRMALAHSRTEARKRVARGVA